MKRLLTLFVIFIMSISVSAAAGTKTEIKDPKLISICSKTIPQKSFEQKIAKDNLEYQKYKKIADGDHQKLIVIIDKILRANNMQYQNWRFGINLAPKDINASSSTVNLIIINTSLYDSLYHNEDALAFVLAHEISHLALGHLQKTYENTVKIEYLKKRMQYAARTNDAVSILILNKKINNICEDERLLEKEADIEALTLISRAGYDTENALEAMELISNLPNIYTKRSTHPEGKTRIAYINKELGILEKEELKKEGQSNLYNNKVSVLKKSSDNKTVVLTKSATCPVKQYVPETEDNKLIKKAYGYYLKNDFDNAKQYFIQAYKINNKNYIPALYLSYISEYEFNQNPSNENLKQVGHWTKKAVKLNPTEPNVIKQKNDMIELAKDFKNSEKL